jgi:hypothetical protein
MLDEHQDGIPRSPDGIPRRQDGCKGLELQCLEFCIESS